MPLLYCDIIRRETEGAAQFHLIIDISKLSSNKYVTRIFVSKKYLSGMYNIRAFEVDA